MLYISLLALLATGALGNPLPGNSMLETRSPSAQSNYLSACEAADNCETYTDPNSGRTHIRFKSGMEPGTEDYVNRVAKAKAKRDDAYPQTQVTVSDATILWGCDTDIIALLGNLEGICATSGQCISNNPYSQDVNYAAPGQTFAETETLTLSATGTYPTWIRNGLVQGIQAAMGASGVISTQTVSYAVSDGPINKNGIQQHGESCSVSTAPSFIGLGVYSAANTLEATISVTAAVGTPGSGFCGTGGGSAAALAGSIAGAFGPVGAGIAAIFGVVSAFCT